MSLVFTTTACRSADEPSPEETPEVSDAEATDYFPFIPDTKFVYEGSGSEYADQTIFFDYIVGENAQRRIQTAGTTVGQVIVAESGKIVLQYSEEEFYSFYPLLNEEANQSEILLMEPLQVGNEWELEDGRVRIITDIEAAISTPYGDFSALEVTTESDESVHKSYYVKDIGLVKSVFEPADASDAIITELASVVEGYSWETDLRVYYPEWEEQNSVHKDFIVPNATNESVESVMTYYLQQDPSIETAAAVLDDDTEIKSIVRQTEQQQVTVDFNDAITKRGMGSDFESQMLQSIVNTIAGYYSVEKVVISVEGGPYETGHFYLGPDDFLVPDTGNSEQI